MPSVHTHKQISMQMSWKIFNCLIIISESIGKRFSYNIGSVQTLSNKLVTEEKGTNTRACSCTGLRIIGLQFRCVVCSLHVKFLLLYRVTYRCSLYSQKEHRASTKGCHWALFSVKFLNLISCLSCSRTSSSKSLLWQFIATHPLPSLRIHPNHLYFHL
jgi:hypothetical protein